MNLNRQISHDYSSISYKTKKINHTPSVDYETLSNRNRILWHFNYLDEEIYTDAFIQSMCTRNQRKAIIKTFKRLTNFENSPMSKTDKNKFCIEMFKAYFIY